MSETRSASVGQLFELAQVLLRSIPSCNLSSEDVQRQIEHEKELRRVLSLVLRANPQEVDLSQLGEILRLSFKFLPRVRVALSLAGYDICEIPAGVTLDSLGLVSKPGLPEIQRFDVIPTKAREVAWMPTDPLIPIVYGDRKGCVTELSNEVRKKFGEGIEAVLPSAEEAAYLLSKYQQKIDQHGFRYTWTINCCGLDHLIVGDFRADSELVVDSWQEGWLRMDLGVLQLIVPRV